jgi:hypothetical protein
VIEGGLTFVGGCLSLLFMLGLGLGALYGLVRFVKRAWEQQHRAAAMSGCSNISACDTRHSRLSTTLSTLDYWSAQLVR